MVYSEFVAADALVRMVNRSLEKLAVCDDERPVAIQIYGKEPGPVADAARIVVSARRWYIPSLWRQMPWCAW